MNKLAALAVLVIPTLTAPALADVCGHSADRSAKVADGTIDKVVVQTGAGDVVLRGEEGRTSVEATGRACAWSKEVLGQISIETRREGTTVYLKTVLPEVESGMFGQRYAYLDLTVLVPKSATVSLEDSSGDLQLSNVRAAVVADSSGDQRIRDIAGDLDVTDSSGDVNIASVGGNLQVQDSSGDVDIDTVRGNVNVSVDSSGDLDIAKVGGTVHIVNDSSGDIEIHDVQQSVKIDADSSGSIRVSGIGGDFTVAADTSGSIEYERVTGTVRLPEED